MTSRKNTCADEKHTTKRSHSHTRTLLVSYSLASVVADASVASRLVEANSSQRQYCLECAQTLATYPSRTGTIGGGLLTTPGKASASSVAQLPETSDCLHSYRIGSTLATHSSEYH
jgi:hypothetical protein